MHRLDRFALLFILVAAAFFPPQANAQDGVCIRQNLAGEWVNRDPQAGDLWRIGISFGSDARPCDPSLIFMSVSRQRADGFELRFSISPFAELIGEQDRSRPTKIAVSANSESCEPSIVEVRGGEQILVPPEFLFFNVIATFDAGNLRVLFRGRTCNDDGGNGPQFQEQYVFERESA